MAHLPEGILLGAGNPLLDIQAVVGKVRAFILLSYFSRISWKSGVSKKMTQFFVTTNILLCKLTLHFTRRCFLSTLKLLSRLFIGLRNFLVTIKWNTFQEEPHKTVCEFARLACYGYWR